MKATDIAQHKGSYEFLKTSLDELVAENVQWKSGNINKPVKVGSIVPMTMIPFFLLQKEGFLKKLYDHVLTSSEEDGAGDDGSSDDGTGSFSNILPVSMYSSAGKCIGHYGEIMDSVLNLEEDDFFRTAILESLKVLRFLPTLWDVLETSFEDLYETALEHDGSLKPLRSIYSKPPAKKARPTRFYTRTIDANKIQPPSGYITPCFFAIASAFLEYSEKSAVSLGIKFDTLLREFDNSSEELQDMFLCYVQEFPGLDYNPQNIGKSSSLYTGLTKFSAFETWKKHVYEMDAKA